MKTVEKQRFEFVLFINGNIICQRYFDIRNYNDESTMDSFRMKEMMDKLVGMNNGPIGTLGIIPNLLKKRSEDYLWKYYKPYTPQSPEDIKRKPSKDDSFSLQVKVDDRVVAEGMFSGKPFPPKVRYQVDIKDVIGDVISEIRYSLSR